MAHLLAEIRRSPLLWLLVLVPVVLTAHALRPEDHTLLFVLSVAAIVPLAALLSRATESVAARIGDMAGGLLNATLGNLTELLIALAALRAGQYVLVKASIAGAIVANALFMLGASFLIGGLRHHMQAYNRSNARLQAGLLFLATVAILIPSVLGDTDAAAEAPAFTHTLSLGLSVLLIVIYALGLVFSLRTHREIFAGAEHAEVGRHSMADVPCSADPRGRDNTGRTGQRDLRRIRCNRLPRRLGSRLPSSGSSSWRWSEAPPSWFRRCPPRARIGWI